ncbi:hypothetical protein BHM03_00026197 [Ensete ventricosum]|nr:hypothetical protein BHM03_00026197 [Ensete ventricosum]
MRNFTGCWCLFSSHPSTVGFWSVTRVHISMFLPFPLKDLTVTSDRSNPSADSALHRVFFAILRPRRAPIPLVSFGSNKRGREPPCRDQEADAGNCPRRKRFDRSSFSFSFPCFSCLRRARHLLMLLVFKYETHNVFVWAQGFEFLD